MKKIALLLVALAPLTAFAKDFTVKVNANFSSLRNSSTADVELIYSPTKAGTVTYSSSSDEAPLRFTSEAGGTLRLKTVKNNVKSISKVKIYYKNDLKELHSDGTGDIDADEINTRSAITLSTRGTGDIDVDIINTRGDMTIISSGTGDIDVDRANCGKLDIKQGGTGDVTVKKGTCSELSIKQGGTGDIEAMVNSKKTDIQLSGTGDVTARSVANLSTSVTGTGDIKLISADNSKITISR